MTDIIFVTTNPIKVLSAKEIGNQFGVTFHQQALELQEIQAADGEPIALYKAGQAYKVIKKPLVVTDDSWIIPGLNGFPGPYARYINSWLSAEDYLRLTNPLQDRRIILKQVIVYQDEHQQKVFISEIEGILLTEARGTSTYGYGHMSITSFDQGKHSAAEMNAEGKSSIGERQSSWHLLCKWLKDQHAK